MYYMLLLFFKNKAAFYKKRTFVNILCYNDQPGTVLKFIEFLRLCHSQQCHHTRRKLVHVCVRIIVQTRQFSAIHFVCLPERILIL